MMATSPPSLCGKICNAKPSGYCGASSSMRHMGTNKEMTNAIPAKALNTLDNGLIPVFFISHFLKTKGTGTVDKCLFPYKKSMHLSGYFFVSAGLLVPTLYVSGTLL